MRKYTRALLWIAAAAGAVLALLAVLLFLAPLLINLEPAKERVVTDISQATGGILVPETISGTFDSLSIDPGIYMLLQGKVRVARLSLERPDMRMSLPED